MTEEEKRTPESRHDGGPRLGPFSLSLERGKVEEEKREREALRKEAPQIGKAKEDGEPEKPEARLTSDRFEPAGERPRRPKRSQGQDELHRRERIERPRHWVRERVSEEVGGEER